MLTAMPNGPLHQWPEGFMWGTGASSTQTEGAAVSSDWWTWEQNGNAPLSDTGNDFATHYVSDFITLANLGLTHHRLGIDWARIEPKRGHHDKEVIEFYMKGLTAARDVGISPWVCLHHFTLPQWFADEGGFLKRENVSSHWVRHVEFIAETFGDLVYGWKPVNETNYYPMAAYRGRGWPPGVNDFESWMVAVENMQIATADAAVRLKQTGKPVSSVFGLSTVELIDKSPASQSFRDFVYAINWNSGLDLFREGVVRLPGREPIHRPDLTGSFDMIGFSYYCALGVREGQLTRFPENALLSPLDYSIWPNGLSLVLDRLHDELPTTPLLIAEYGIGTDDDEQRAQYLADGLRITADALERGVDVKGFFHWTAVDNYEWLHGFDIKFGIIDRDRNVRPSAMVLTRETKQ
jgi:beta-glucosidase